MAENRYRGNNRLDNPNQGRGFFDRSLAFNKFNLPIVTEGWEGYVLTINDDGVVSLVLSGNGGSGTTGTSGTSGS